MAEQTEPLLLVADDEVHTTIMLERIFEREGFRVQSVHDGVTALEAAQRLMPDLILLDIQMPGMNGFDVLRSLRQNPHTTMIPTILITAKARQPADVAHGLNLGADDYVQKPFEPRELVARVQSKIRSYQLEVALQRRTQELEALLRVGEELNQYVEVGELLNLVPYLVLDLLPGTAAAIYQVDEAGRLVNFHVESKNGSGVPEALGTQAVVDRFMQSGQPLLWPGEQALMPAFPSGMVVPLQHADAVLGMLMLLSPDVVYDESHLRLFKGIGRQTALSLRNAQLYEVQMNYAQHLEEMVAARTAELQSAQQLLIRAEKLAAIGHLAASIAHEINNPLQPIRTILDDMQEDIQRKLPIDIRDVKTIQESVDRIRRIVSQLLEFAGKRNTTNTDLQRLDITKILEGIITLNRKFFEKEGLSIEAELEQLPEIYGNKDQLEQVFMNLVLNAQSAMKRGGRLKIRARADQNDIVIQFSDTGHGIPPEQLNKIFDPFYSTKPTGTGLGLFVSYGIIQSHHGMIEVNSHVGVGTTFIIRLPIHTGSTTAISE
ncbi:MAG: response regulator [Chloroflexi bacterium]|nr:response regulator [Chloroflexota bacterium]